MQHTVFAYYYLQIHQLAHAFECPITSFHRWESLERDIDLLSVLQKIDREGRLGWRSWQNPLI